MNSKETFAKGSDFINNENSFFNNTGLVFLKDTKQEYYLYYREHKLLIPLEQFDLIVPLSRNNSEVRIKINDYQYIFFYVGKLILNWRLPTKEEKDMFLKLEKIDMLKSWNISKKKWLIEGIGGDSNLYYYKNSKIIDLNELRRILISGFKTEFVRNITLNSFLNITKLSILQCIDLNDTNKSYDSSWEEDFRIWKKWNLLPIDVRENENKKDENFEDKNLEDKNLEDNNLEYENELLECDNRRCRLDKYPKSQLYDIQKGHWDLYNKNIEDSDNNKMISRDPRKDIKNGVVGIDFGTKSTVVVKQDDTNKVIPIRIGKCNLSEETKESDYENPTIIECTNLVKFLNDYNSIKGRPKTNCNDFFISYDAYNDYVTCAPDDFYAYYTQLKQWANNDKTNVLIRDKSRNNFSFDSKNSEENKIINPVELYAYYIGMYINNMFNGIYMNYLLSFPVRYSKKTRKLILDSFEKGIKKSLPEVVLEDENCMKDFNIQFGISEPAAYAVTARELSNLEPENENDEYIYGVFDFGGGTTDFDFGVWRGVSSDEYDDGYDYVLECFGADSDITLGGENILELLAYHIFKENEKFVREKRLTCSLPIGEKPFLGSERLIDNSQISMHNMLILKEELRPLWHQEKNWENKYKEENSEDGNSYLEVTLYNIDEKQVPNCKLNINTDDLIEIIKQRIEKGIDAFFKCMAKTFNNIFEDYEKIPNDKIRIFLAGNASKSVFVKDLFKEKIEFYNKKLEENYSNNESSYFELIDPLENKKKNGQYTPNAKTSVAYGLLKSRKGSSIKIEKNKETDAEEEARFKYYLGKVRRGKFECILNPKEKEYQWVKFQSVKIQSIIKIYYTSNPIADCSNENIDIDNIQYKEIKIQPEENKFLYIRTSKSEPTEIEYSVAISEDEIDENEILKLSFDN